MSMSLYAKHNIFSIVTFFNGELAEIINSTISKRKSWIQFIFWKISHLLTLNVSPELTVSNTAINVGRNSCITSDDPGSARM